MTTLEEQLQRSFGYSQFRPHQKAVCEALLAGKDVLLVMPTGSGKSLCYQLPGLLRQGPTLVVSPLIALMEDQVQKLRALGLKAERIHSGIDRLDHRGVLEDLKQQKIDYLFVAPERLGVPGFLDSLGDSGLGMIAIDEAHCISAWGHDFRPEYRAIGQRLKNLRHVPIIAMTATATPIVQKDIIEQLGLETCARHIHGFRRENIAIEVLDVAPEQRPSLIQQTLKDKAATPAIIYTATRRQADELASFLKCKAYHAGLSTDERQKIQQDFLSGRQAVIVATVAFGMGVDKGDIRTVFHAALPSSLENYYQEIGRAGRDGQPSRAVLLYSFQDRRIHDFLLQKNYPNVGDLEELLEQIKNEGTHKLQLETEWDLPTLDAALEKLRLHGAIHMDYSEVIYPLKGEWQVAYRWQKEHKVQQLEMMERYVSEAQQCRMLQLMAHFGDADDPVPCGRCDVCAPEQLSLQKTRLPDFEDRQLISSLLRYLRENNAPSVGRLHKEGFADKNVSRPVFDQLLQSLQRAGYVRLYTDAFQKNGRTIEYRRVGITPRGMQVDAKDLSLMQLVELAPRFKTSAGKKKPASSKQSAAQRAFFVRRAKAKSGKR